MNSLGRCAAAIGFAVALNGCGGGGHGSVAALPPASATNTAAPQTQAQTGSGTFNVVIPAAPAGSAVARAGRTPQYVSSGTASVTIAQGTKVLGTFNTTASSPGCQQTQTGVSCSFSVGPTVGANQVFTVTAYALSNGTGGVLSTGSTVVTVTANANTAINVTMGGQVASLAVTLPNPNPNAGTPLGGLSVIVQAKDAAGYTIVGPGSYTTPISVASDDPTGIVKLAVNGGTAAQTATLNAPSDTVALAYNGHNLGFSAITASTTPNGGSALTSAPSYFTPTPVVVKTIGATFNGYINAISPTFDAVTGSYWFSLYNLTTNQYQLIVLAPNGSTATYNPGQAPTTNLPNCNLNAIYPNGPGNKVWFASGCNPGQYGFIDPATLSTTSFTMPGNFANFGTIAGVQTGDNGIYASIYDYTSNAWSLVHVDNAGNVEAELSNANLGSSPTLAGSSVYFANSNTVDLATIGGTGPSATLAYGGLVGFPYSVLNRPVVASDGTLWDGQNCNITHFTPATPFSASKAIYYPLPAANCVNQQVSLNSDVAITPDRTVWVTTYNGTLFGVPSSQPPASAPFSITSIPTVTFGGNSYPFSPNYGTVAADGNLAFIGSYNGAVYVVELAY